MVYISDCSSAFGEIGGYFMLGVNVAFCSPGHGISWIGRCASSIRETAYLKDTMALTL